MGRPDESGHTEQSYDDMLHRLGGGPRRDLGRAEDAGHPTAEQPVVSWLAGSPASGPIDDARWAAAWGVSDQPGTWAAPGSANSPWAADDQRAGTEEQAPSADEWGEPDDFASAVRPYTWTKGRTRPVHDLAVETLVSTTSQGRDVTALTSVEHRAVAELCMQPRSVAEVGALLSLPLGVARVLLADMADIGLVVVHRTATGSGGTPDVDFMERVLSGLRRL